MQRAMHPRSGLREQSRLRLLWAFVFSALVVSAAPQLAEASSRGVGLVPSVQRLSACAFGPGRFRSCGSWVPSAGAAFGLRTMRFQCRLPLRSPLPAAPEPIHRSTVPGFVPASGSDALQLSARRTGARRCVYASMGTGPVVLEPAYLRLGSVSSPSISFVDSDPTPSVPRGPPSTAA
jgi:hypothetical protein